MDNAFEENETLFHCLALIDAAMRCFTGKIVLVTSESDGCTVNLLELAPMADLLSLPITWPPEVDLDRRGRVGDVWQSADEQVWHSLAQHKNDQNP